MFYSHNTILLPPKSDILNRISKNVLVSADKAANNVVVVCRLHYINTLNNYMEGSRSATIK